MNNEIKSTGIINSNELIKKHFAKINWLGEYILPPGLLLVAGRPKSGKSFLTLYIAAQLSRSAKIFDKYISQKRNILFISNEDSEKRIKDRIENSNINYDNLSFYFDSFIFEDGFELELKKLISTKKIDLIIVDTLAKAIKMKSSNRNAYYVEYEQMGSIQNFCRKNNISIILVHHTRKAPADNPIDRILGTTGMSGAVDTIWLLEKKHDMHILQVEGKDVESQSINLKQDISSNEWNLLDANYNTTPEREEILEVLSREQKVMSTSDIAKAIGKGNPATSNLLSKMKKDGLIISPKYGCYKLNSEYDVSS